MRHKYILLYYIISVQCPNDNMHTKKSPGGILLHVQVNTESPSSFGVQWQSSFTWSVTLSSPSSILSSYSLFLPCASLSLSLFSCL